MGLFTGTLIIAVARIGPGTTYLDGRNSQKYLHQDQADF